MKTLVALFGKKSTSSVSSFMDFSLSNHELNSVRGGTDPLGPIWMDEEDPKKKPENP